MPRVTVAEIAELVEGRWTGDPSRAVTGVRTLADAGPDDLSFLANPKYAPALGETRAGVILVGQGLEGESDRWLRVEDPYFALSQVISRWFQTVALPEGVSDRAAIAPGAKLGSNVAVAPFVSIGEGAVIGDDVVLFAGVTIGAGASVGDGSILYPNVTVYHGCSIGRRCIVHAGSVIGGDGFGFATRKGTHHKIPQIGIVRIEDDVEIGAGTTIDRAALGETVIGEGTKIDDQVMIAHNVVVGKRCLIAAQTGIAGSTRIEDDCVFGGQVGVVGHVHLGPKLMVGAKSAVMKSMKGPETVSGIPARPLRERLRHDALVARLPKLVKRLEALERAAARRRSDDDPD